MGPLWEGTKDRVEDWRGGGPCCRTQTPDHLLTTVLAAEYLFRPGTVRAPSQTSLTSPER